MAALLGNIGSYHPANNDSADGASAVHWAAMKVAVIVRDFLCKFTRLSLIIIPTPCLLFLLPSILLCFPFFALLSRPLHRQVCFNDAGRDSIYIVPSDPTARQTDTKEYIGCLVSSNYRVDELLAQ